MKARIYLFGRELVDKVMRKKYCHKGFHRIYPGSIGWGGTNQRMKYIHYLKCRHCNYIFFASPNDKKRYLKMQDRERSAFHTMLSCLKDEALIENGSSVWKEASSRASSGIHNNGGNGK